MTMQSGAPDPALVVLVRHGQAAAPDRAGRYFSKAPVPLTEFGRHQAVQVGGFLQHLQVDALYASDLLRARQTAEIISTAVGMPVRYDDRLREVDTGDLDGSTIEELQRAYPAFLPWVQAGFRQGFASNVNHFEVTLRFPGGECVLEAAERAVSAFRGICERHSGSCVAIVSHAWVSSSILCHVMDIPVDHYFRFGQVNAGISILRAGRDGRGMLDGLNLSAPLELLAGGSLPLLDRATRGSDE